jgi:hypothetical protein
VACQDCGSKELTEDRLSSGLIEYNCRSCGRQWEVSAEAVDALCELVALPDREPGKEGNLSRSGTLAPLHPSPGKPSSVCLAEVEPEEVDWLWHPYIPLRKLTIVEGNPGEGKSWITAAIGAALSTEGFLPGARDLGGGKSLYLTAEDGLADILRPRLDALGADCTKTFAYRAPVDLNTEEGLETLESEIRDRGPMVVFIDPVVAFVGAGTDTYRANQVRGIMAPLSHLARVPMRRRCGAPPQQGEVRQGDLPGAGVHRLHGSGTLGVAGRERPRRAGEPRDHPNQVQSRPLG